MPEPDVFCFGNLKGDAGGDPFVGGDDDPTNDVAPGDELWNQFVEELFTTIEAVLDQQLAASLATAS